MQVWRMRTGISITVKPADRRRLKVLTRNRNTPHKHVWRAEIVLLSADGVGTNEIMRRTGKSKTCVWRWQERFMQAGYDKSHGTTTLFATLNDTDGTVIGRNMQHHRHQECRFLNAIEAQVPVQKSIHAIVDNYATHKH